MKAEEDLQGEQLFISVSAWKSLALIHYEVREIVQLNSSCLLNMDNTVHISTIKKPCLVGLVNRGHALDSSSGLSDSRILLHWAR